MDPDGDSLTYSLSGSDSTAFILSNVIDGGLLFNTDLDYETKTSYEVIVTATDTYGLSSSITLTIIINNVNEAPKIRGESSLRYTEDNTGAIYTYTANDPEQDLLTWTVRGEDDTIFDINRGTLYFRLPPDFENPTDADENGIYEVVVTASDEEYSDSMSVTVIVVDSGVVTFSSIQPYVGTPLTVQLIESDMPILNTVWQWKRQDNSLWEDVIVVNTKSYIPSTGDVNYMLKVLVSYIDSAGTQKYLESPVTKKVLTRIRPPVSTGGSGSGGGGGSVVRDQHGNSVNRATQVSLEDFMSSTPGVINSRTDVDYFRFDIPHDGLFIVRSTGSAFTNATMWQVMEDGELELLNEGEDTGSLGRNFQMRSKVEEGEVIVAVQGKNRRTGNYNLVTDLIVGLLENPGPNSKRSGIGVLSGWVCDAENVEVELDGNRVMKAAYGTSRTDTSSVCGDSNNGFGLLFNWNLLDRSQKQHTARLLVDGEELDQTTFTVTNFGEEFLKDVSGEATVKDFPKRNDMFRLVWQQALQNFMLAPMELPEVGDKPMVSLPEALLENPHHASLQSGVGVLSGWVCDAESVEVEIDGEGHRVAYGTERTDTMSMCGDSNNGFGLLYNWNHLEDGVHTAKLIVDGEVVDQTKFVVTTLGQEFLKNVQKTVMVSGFPKESQKTSLEWQQSDQNFIITDVTEE